MIPLKHPSQYQQNKVVDCGLQEETGRRTPLWWRESAASGSSGFSEDLTWTYQTDTITKTARKWLFFLCRMRLHLLTYLVTYCLQPAHIIVFICIYCTVYKLFTHDSIYLSISVYLILYIYMLACI